MDYEGQAELPGDDCCDVCAGGFGLFPGWEDYTAPWQPERLREDLSVYGFFSRNRRRYSINEAARVLAGRREWGLEDDEVRDLLTYYVKAGLIKKGKRFFFKDAICPTPRAIEDSHSEKPQPRGKP
jgi:hypothetical protein